MPIYEFVCEGCGPFEKRLSFEESGDPLPCPTCGTTARRVYSLFGTTRTSAPLSRALDRSAKSAHEPEVVSKPPGRTKAPGHSHGRPWTLGH